MYKCDNKDENCVLRRENTQGNRKIWSCEEPCLFISKRNMIYQVAEYHLHFSCFDEDNMDGIFEQRWGFKGKGNNKDAYT